MKRQFLEWVESQPIASVIIGVIWVMTLLICQEALGIKIVDLE